MALYYNKLALMSDPVSLTPDVRRWQLLQQHYKIGAIKSFLIYY